MATQHQRQGLCRHRIRQRKVIMKRMFAPDEEKPSIKIWKYVGVGVVLCLLGVGLDERASFGVSCSIHSGEKAHGNP